MTAALFREIVGRVRTLAGLDQLMMRYWPDVIATEAERNELLGLVLSRQIELATAPCESGIARSLAPDLVGVLE